MRPPQVADLGCIILVIQVRSVSAGTRESLLPVRVLKRRAAVRRRDDRLLGVRQPLCGDDRAAAENVVAALPLRRMRAVGCVGRAKD